MSSDSNEADVSVRIRVLLRNGNVSSEGAHCNIDHLTIVNTSQVIYLRQVTNEIISGEVLYSSTINSSYPNICVYQDMFPQTSRFISLSASQENIDIYLVLNGQGYSSEKASFFSSFEYIDLKPFASPKTNEIQCGVQTSTNHDFQKLTSPSTLYYENNTMNDYYVELYVVADQNFYLNHKNESKNFIYQIINNLNAIYQSLGIHVLLVGVEVWETANSVVSSDFKTTLLNLVNYRSTLTKKHDVIHLIAGKQFANNVTGYSYTGGMCRYQYSAGISTEFTSSNAFTMATVVAHELSHNLGMKHDDSGCTCPPDKFCIMNSLLLYYGLPRRFSDCSLRGLSTTLNLLEPSGCLKDIPDLKTVSNANLCGNGIVEGTEDCDPGLSNTAQLCCNSLICKYRSGAQCASGRCCNKTTCQPRASGSVCRNITNECDLPEYCDGVGEQCPEDRNKANGVSCDTQSSGSSAYCYNGKCNSRDLQCQNFFGSESKSSNIPCYENLNQAVGASLSTGWCSYSLQSMQVAQPIYSFMPCSTGNFLCGRLHCLSVSADIDAQNDATLGFKCFHTIFDMNFTEVRDPSMVPNGAPCSTGKWCVDSICRNIPDLPVSCTCQGRGVCNDLLHCHCNNGSSGIDCGRTFGCGGSNDSGPPLCALPISSTTSTASTSSTSDTVAAVTVTPSPPMWIIIGAAGGGGALLVIILIVVLSVVCCKRVEPVPPPPLPLRDKDIVYSNNYSAVYESNPMDLYDNAYY